jgi:hypothetical protein
MHVTKNMASDSARNLVWEGTIPVCFSLHPEDLREGRRRDIGPEACYVSLCVVNNAALFSCFRVSIMMISQVVSFEARSSGNIRRISGFLSLAITID